MPFALLNPYVLLGGAAYLAAKAAMKAAGVAIFFYVVTRDRWEDAS